MTEVGGLTETGAIVELTEAIKKVNDTILFLARNNIEVNLSFIRQQEMTGSVDREILSAVVRKMMRKI